MPSHHSYLLDRADECKLAAAQSQTASDRAMYIRFAEIYDKAADAEAQLQAVEAKKQGRQ